MKKVASRSTLRRIRRGLREQSDATVYVTIDVDGSDNIGEWDGELECAVDTRDGEVYAWSEVDQQYTLHHGLSDQALHRARRAAGVR